MISKIEEGREWKHRQHEKRTDRFCKVQTSILYKDEERISALGKRSEELTQDAVQRDTKKEEMNESWKAWRIDWECSAVANQILEGEARANGNEAVRERVWVNTFLNWRETLCLWWKRHTEFRVVVINKPKSTETPFVNCSALKIKRKVLKANWDNKSVLVRGKSTGFRVWLYHSLVVLS